MQHHSLTLSQRSSAKDEIEDRNADSEPLITAGRGNNLWAFPVAFSDGPGNSRILTNDPTQFEVGRSLTVILVIGFSQRLVHNSRETGRVTGQSFSDFSAVQTCHARFAGTASFLLTLKGSP